MQKRTMAFTTIILLTLLLVPFQVNAEISAKGIFTAHKQCQAYQSIRKRTNSDSFKLRIGDSYPIIARNVPNNTTWFRVRIADAEPKDRWVYFQCGKADVSSKRKAPGRGRKTGQQCSTAGLEDSYVFAVSWQPAFCSKHRDKPECQVTDPNSYQAKNFTLHGLWPNKASCGTHYGFCGKYKKGMRPFCNFTKVPMRAETLNALGKVMPSAAYGSCLQRHEWYKHGTCQTEWNADQYYSTAMRLVKEFNEQGMSGFMQRHMGKHVPTEAFLSAVDRAFGKNAHKRMKIICKGNDLTDIYINLPATIPSDKPLKNLIQQGTASFNNKCGSSFFVDPIGP